MTTQSQIDQSLRLISFNSRPDLTDGRLRFLPRDALYDIISADRVLKVLQSRPKLPDEQQSDLAGLVERISPPIHGCRCKWFHCTGGRIIFAALLSLPPRPSLPIPELIGAAFQKTNQIICDAFLPQQYKPPNETDGLSNILGVTLLPDELSRFLHFTWQMRSPFMQNLISENPVMVQPEILEYPANASLPWVSFIKDNVAGQDEAMDVERTTVYRIVIHPYHREVAKLEGDLALKISDDYMAERKYKREVKANLRIPQHDRIVPLLAAFKHREKFHLVLPWAHGGNLADLFREYSTPTTTAVAGQRIAGWYSEDWLLAECLGVAEGLAAVHQTPTSRQIHADIKPENILCFASSVGDSGMFTLKLADFGEAQQVHPDTKTIPVKRAPHTKTYRPPEHDTDKDLRLNYDVWCLACVFLEFITWAIVGSEAIDEFEKDRLEEVDDPKVSTAKGTVLQDTFFKKVSASWRPRILPHITFGHDRETTEDQGLPRSDYRRRHRWSFEYARGTRVKTLRKKAVEQHITFLQKKCKDTRLHTFLDFISSSMLVVDPTQRVESSAVCTFLDGLQE